MTYAIEKNVPLPDETASQSRVYPFATMDLNDSFPVAKSKAHTARNAMYAYVRQMKDKGREVKFTTRTMEDGGIRIWRTL